MKLFYCLLLALFCNTAAIADTFYVTNNADAGPGTLRQAMISSNANGYTNPDIILFNLPDLSEAGRTINLLSVLPVVGAYLTIDGSSQPGAFIGNSNAKVILSVNQHMSSDAYMIRFVNGLNIKVLGLFFRVADITYIDVNYGIDLRHCRDVVIGEPGKGNRFEGVPQAIHADYQVTGFDSITNIKIQSNYIGSSFMARGNIYLVKCRNVQIGGPTVEEGNKMLGGTIQLHQSDVINPEFFALIENNWLGYNGPGNQVRTGEIVIHGHIGYVDSASAHPKLIIRKNMIAGDGYYGSLLVDNVSLKTVITGNRFGTNNGPAPNFLCYGRSDIILYGSNIEFGGHSEEEQNTAGGNIHMSAYGVHILKNMIGYNITLTTGAGPLIKITSYDNGLIQGTADPGSKIQVYTDACWTTCLNKRYLATTYANAGGIWTFPYTAGMPALTATSTRPSDSSTSSFTEPKYDNSTWVVKHATCGRSNGSVTGMKIVAGTHIRWYNQAGQLVGTDTNLVNVPAGYYQLKVSNGANGCIQGLSVEIMNFDVPPVASVSSTNASCGQPNGSIVHSNYGFSNNWLNHNYDSIATGQQVNNLAPGSYYLKLWTASDTSCNRTYGPFVISNLNGPSFNLATAAVTHATCNNNNGAISGVQVLNAIGTPYLIWVDSANNIYGNALSVNNLAPGRYRLKYKDAAPCDTIITPYFLVQQQGQITINTNAMQVLASDCGLSTGNITGIVVAGATQFEWINQQGQVVGNAINTSNLPAGTYILKVSNSFNCSADSDSIRINNRPFIVAADLQTQVQPGTCNNSNGFINILNFPDPQLYSFRWVNTLNPAVTIATTLNLSGIHSGTYTLYAINAGGCQQEVITKLVPVILPVALDESAMQTTHPTCGLSNGNIKHILPVAGSGTTSLNYTWINQAGETMATAADFNNAAAGTYRLLVTDNNGCRDTSTAISLTNTTQNLPAPVYNPVTVLTGHTADLVVLNPLNNATYYLYDNSQAITAIATGTSGNFTTPVITGDKEFFIKAVTGTCTSSLISVWVKAMLKFGIAVPSAFTPNGDSKNDYLKATVYGTVEHFSFRVYNRYGQLIFSSGNPSFGWDGSVLGTAQETGTFVWICSYKLQGHPAKLEKGTTTLVR